MNSNFGDMFQGFLNKTSVLHSVACRLNSGVIPASISSQCSIGVNSTAAVGPKLELPCVTLRSAAPPNSTTATSFGSLSGDCATAEAVHNKQVSKNARPFLNVFPTHGASRVSLSPSRMRPIVPQWFPLLRKEHARMGHPFIRSGVSKERSLCGTHGAMRVGHSANL